LIKIKSASTVLFSTPEFNHSIPSVLKSVIDWVSCPVFRSPLFNKPCGILSSSVSSVGGARAQTHLKNVLLSTLNRLYPAVDYLLPDAHEKFNSEGQLIDTEALNRLQNYVDGLIIWAEKIES